MGRLKDRNRRYESGAYDINKTDLTQNGSRALDRET